MQVARPRRGLISGFLEPGIVHTELPRNHVKYIWPVHRRGGLAVPRATVRDTSIVAAERCRSVRNSQVLQVAERVGRVNPVMVGGFRHITRFGGCDGPQHELPVVAIYQGAEATDFVQQRTIAENVSSGTCK